MDEESNIQFEQRKRDHIRIALDPKSQTDGQSGLESVELVHEALPDTNFKEVDISTSFSFKNTSLALTSPVFISSMTAGHEKGQQINLALAKLSDRRQILMGVGSQRRELVDSQALMEWKTIRKSAPNARLLANIGISQLVQSPLDKIKALVDSTEAVGMFVHVNPLQEALQPEGTTNFKGGLQALEKLAAALGVPVIVKEVGCGFSTDTLKRLDGTGVFAVDVSGKGGTHWGRVEGLRSSSEQLLYKVAETFADWGVSTTQSLLNAEKAQVSYELWASGGVRNGLELAKLCALGAKFVGFAKPFLAAALQGDEELENLLDQLEMELKVALFCTGSLKVSDLRSKRVIK